MSKLLINEEPITLSRDGVKDAVIHGLNNVLVKKVIIEMNIFTVNELTVKLPFLSARTIQRSLAYWRKEGLVVKGCENWKYTKDLLLSGTIKQERICEWCEDSVLCLQEHHYPIPKNEGGEEVVRICPNCHYGFHHIESAYTIRHGR